MTANAEKTTRQIVGASGFAASGDLDTTDKQTNSWYKKVREMRKHPTIALARQLAVAPLLAADWSVETKDDAPDGAKEFIEAEFIPQRSHLLRTSLYGCLDFGWQPYEKVLTMRDDGKIGFKKLKPLLQDMTTIKVVAENGVFDGMQQDGNTGNAVALDVDECLLVNINVEGTNWYGCGAMEAIEPTYDSWQTADKSNKQYDKKIAGAHWVVHYPPGQTPVGSTVMDNFEIAKTMLARLEASGSMVLPRWVEGQLDSLMGDNGIDTAWKVELLSADASTGAGFIDRLRYLDANICRAYGLPERAVIEGEFGTKAEAEAHADFAITNMQLRLDGIIEQYNWHGVNHLLRLNYGPKTENSVFIKAAPLTDLALQFLREVYKALIGNEQLATAEVDNIDFDQLRDRLGLPTLSDAARTEQDLNKPVAALAAFSRGLFPATN